MKKLLLFMMVLQTTIMVNAQQWTTLNPYPTNKPIHAVAFTSENNGFIAGNKSTFMRTTDGGESWEHVPFPVPDVPLTSLKFRNEMHGALVSWSHIYITHDGGETWNHTKKQLNGDYLDSFFLNDSVGWVCGTYQIVAKTEDGGQTWTTLSNSIVSARHHKVIEFANEQTGYVAGYSWGSTYYPVLKRTDDGGISWQELPIPEGVESIMGMSLLGPDNIWITAENNIYNPDLPGYVAAAFHSTDGGQTWTLHHLSENYSPGVSKIKFIDENNGYAITYSDLFITNDGGQSWEEYIIFGATSNSFTDISITENQSIYISSSKPGLWKSTDGGNNWENKFVGEIGNLTDITFVDDNLGYLCGYDNLKNYVFKTEDGGQNWEESYSEQRTNASPIIRLEITDLGHIISATLNRRIIKSTDQGANWEVFDATTDVSINSLTVPSEEVIFAGTSGGTIFKSTNGAESWSEINFPIIPGYFLTKDLHFFDGLNGLGAMNKLSNQGKLFRTRDGGQTWVELHYGYTNRIQGISFYNQSVGIINVEDIGLLKTLDGGQSWSTIYENPSINHVEIFDEQTFLATNSNRLVVVTNNGGDTWHTAYESGPTGDQINSMFFLNPGKGWLTGGASLIQVYDDPLMSVEEKLPLPIAQSPSIYPNPAQSRFMLDLSHDFAGANIDKLSLFDQQGRVVRVWHKLPLKATVELDGLPAGLYHIVAEAGTDRRTGRLSVY